MTLSKVKSVARKAAFARRKIAHTQAFDSKANDRLLEYLRPYRGQVFAAYMPIHTEINPLPVMAKMATYGPVCVPVIQGAGQALKFREWTPDCDMIAGPFRAKVPALGAWLIPEIILVPLVAYDCNGGRLGYGGGFYDRTLEGLRSIRPTLAIGFAYGAQQADILPLEATDQPLDALVNEHAVLQF